MAQQYNGPRRPQRERNILDDGKFKLSAPPLPGAKDRPSLQPGFERNNPYLLVRTGFPNDKDYGKIKAKMDMEAFQHIFVLLERVCSSDKPSQYTQDNKGKPFINGQPSKDLLVETTTVVGRDDKGRIYISVLSYDKSRPKVIFYFGDRYYHATHSKDESYSTADKSTDRCRSWMRSIEKVLGPVAAANWVPPDNDQNGGNRGGGGGGGGYNQRGNSAPVEVETPSEASSYEDNLPF